MKFKKFDQSTKTNPDLAPLITLKASANEWKNMPNRALRGESLEIIQKFYTLLTGKDFDGEDTFYRISFDEEGRFRKMYPPSFYRSIDALELGDAEACIRWGDTFIPVSVSDDKSSFVAVNAPKIKFAIQNAEIGRFSELSIKASYLDMDTETQYVMHFPVRILDWNNKPEAEDLEAYLAMGKADKVLDQISFVKLGGGDGSETKGMTSLPLNTPVMFNALKPIQRKDGTTTFVLTDLEGEKWWATSNLVQLLNAGALCDADNYVVVTRSLRSNGKNTYDYDVQWPVEESGTGLDLSWAN